MSTGSTLAPASSPINRSGSPGEKTQYCSTTGLDIEAQIADGGGLAAMRAGGTDPMPTTATPTPMMSPAQSHPPIMTDRQSPPTLDIPMKRLVSLRRCEGATRSDVSHHLRDNRKVIVDILLHQKPPPVLPRSARTSRVPSPASQQHPHRKGREACASPPQQARQVGSRLCQYGARLLAYLAVTPSHFAFHVSTSRIV